MMYNLTIINRRNSYEINPHKNIEASTGANCKVRLWNATLATPRLILQVMTIAAITYIARNVYSAIQSANCMLKKR